MAHFVERKKFFRFQKLEEQNADERKRIKIYQSTNIYIYI